MLREELTVLFPNCYSPLSSIVVDRAINKSNPPITFCTHESNVNELLIGLAQYCSRRNWSTSMRKEVPIDDSSILCVHCSPRRPGCSNSYSRPYIILHCFMASLINGVVAYFARSGYPHKCRVTLSGIHLCLNWIRYYFRQARHFPSESSMRTSKN